MLYDLIQQSLKGETRNIKCLLSVTVAGVQGTIERMRVSYEFLSGNTVVILNRTSAVLNIDPIQVFHVPRLSFANVTIPVNYQQTSSVHCCSRSRKLLAAQLLLLINQVLFTYLYSTQNYVVLYYSLHNFTLCTITVT